MMHNNRPYGLNEQVLNFYLPNNIPIMQFPARACLSDKNANEILKESLPPIGDIVLYKDYLAFFTDSYYNAHWAKLFMFIKFTLKTSLFFLTPIRTVIESLAEKLFDAKGYRNKYKGKNIKKLTSYLNNPYTFIIKLDNISRDIVIHENSGPISLSLNDDNYSYLIIDNELFLDDFVTYTLRDTFFGDWQSRFVKAFLELKE